MGYHISTIMGTPFQMYSPRSVWDHGFNIGGRGAASRMLTGKSTFLTQANGKFSWSHDYNAVNTTLEIP